jgi:hypothetical protein
MSPKNSYYSKSASTQPPSAETVDASASKYAIGTFRTIGSWHYANLCHRRNLICSFILQALSTASQEILDDRGIGGYGQVETVVSLMLQLASKTREEARSLTTSEAMQLHVAVQMLSPFDRQAVFAQRARSTNRGGRYQRKKGEGNAEIETCAK